LLPKQIETLPEPRGFFMHLPSVNSFFRPESAAIANELPEIPGFFYFCSLTSFIQKNHTMGRGDKKTAKGKRFQGSFGKSRPAKATKQKKPVVAKAS